MTDTLRSDVLLQADDIAIGYQSAALPVLENFSLRLARGEVVSILGASGVGKSSLLRVLAGLQSPLRGSVSLFGEALRQPHPRVAVAFQDPALLPWLTLEKNVAFGLGFARQPRLRKSELRARVTSAIAAVGLEHASAHYPSQLSGGMAQRAALARCLAREPHVLLLDEPFGALDEITRGDMQKLLLSLVRRLNTGTVLITHDIDEALLVSDRVVVLGGSPAGIVGEWRIALPQPRDDMVEALGRLRIDILKTLRRAGRGGSDSNSTTETSAEVIHVPGRSNSFAA